MSEIHKSYKELKDNMVIVFVNNLFSGKSVDVSLDYMFLNIWAWAYNHRESYGEMYPRFSNMTEDEIKLEFKISFVDVLSGKDNLTRLVHRTADYILSYSVQKLKDTSDVK